VWIKTVDPTSNSSNVNHSDYSGTTGITSTSKAKVLDDTLIVTENGITYSIDGVLFPAFWEVDLKLAVSLLDPDRYGLFQSIFALSDSIPVSSTLATVLVPTNEAMDRVFDIDHKQHSSPESWLFDAIFQPNYTTSDPSGATVLNYTLDFVDPYDMEFWANNTVITNKLVNAHIIPNVIASLDDEYDDTSGKYSRPFFYTEAKDGSLVSFMPASINQLEITDKTILANNGVIHGIDGVNTIDGFPEDPPIIDPPTGGGAAAPTVRIRWLIVACLVAVSCLVVASCVVVIVRRWPSMM
jgi:uncharacterized surface protein with fasciclin (FAS1) repeats